MQVLEQNLRQVDRDIEVVEDGIASREGQIRELRKNLQVFEEHRADIVEAIETLKEARTRGI